MNVTNLPEWRLTLCSPLYDTYSKSPTEMTAQVYGKMREIVNSYNEFATSMNKAFTEFTEGTIKDVQEFEQNITCLMNEYIQSVDNKLLELNSNLEKIIEEKIREGIISYNEEYEEIVVGGVS